MRCPVDGETLVMADRSGVEIDYCPKCRGVWLDRGELDKIIERAAGTMPAPAPAPRAADAPVSMPRPAEPPRRRDRDDDDDDDRRRDGYRSRRRESFLGDLFDF
jgi:hypothetical protein